MEMYVWLVGGEQEKGEWRCAWVEPGVPTVTVHCGEMPMPGPFVGNLAITTREVTINC